ncbi:LysE family translocator [Blastococcus deserti]|uniref:LysE family translocator n=1 Tax=Blastococcus deserti TaxID=2259033 RepID=A0ABW4XAG1_9ACTN
MTLGSAVATFAVVAAVLTLTPGLDTALVLRAVLTRGRREALATAAGIVAGLLVWGAAAAVGVSALLTASRFAFDVLRYAGAVYLMAYGVRLVVAALRRRPAPGDPAPAVPGAGWRAARAGLFTNLLNPKVGAFYVALLPQFVPAGSDPLLVGLLLAAVHGALSTVWFLVLTFVAGALGRWLRRPATVRAIDGLTGATLVGFGVRLAVAGR